MAVAAGMGITAMAAATAIAAMEIAAVTAEDMKVAPAPTPAIAGATEAGSMNTAQARRASTQNEPRKAIAAATRLTRAECHRRITARPKTLAEDTPKRAEATAPDLMGVVRKLMGAVRQAMLAVQTHTDALVAPMAKAIPGRRPWHGTTARWDLAAPRA